jgi:carboxyl-terminal processing protease
MPDYFIPVDTTSAIHIAGTTPLYREIYYRGIVYKYTRTLIEANRNKYKEQYPTFDSFNKNFTVTNSMLNDMMDVYRKEKAEEHQLRLLKKDPETDNVSTTAEEIEVKTNQLSEKDQQNDLEKSKSLLSMQIKMNIAREIYSDNEYYQLLNPLYDSYNKAIVIINDEKEYNKLLNQDKG